MFNAKGARKRWKGCSLIKSNVRWNDEKCQIRFDGQLLFIHGLEIKEVTTKTEHSVSSRYTHFDMNKSDEGVGGVRKTLNLQEKFKAPNNGQQVAGHDDRPNIF